MGKTMMMCGALLLTAQMATAGSYADHPGVMLFTHAPCGDVVDTIMGAPPLDAGIEAIAHHEAKRGMAWGFLLGFDTARGGLHQGEDSTLTRLRDACAANPEATAQDLLSGF